jgi:hypothetical protein
MVEAVGSSGCAIAGFGAPEVISGNFGCGTGVPAIRPQDGRIVSVDRYAPGLFVFAADVPAIDDDGLCGTLGPVTSNDERLPTPACDEDESFPIVDDARIKPAGGYLYHCLLAGWFDSDGRARPVLNDLQVNAVDHAGNVFGRRGGDWVIVNDDDDLVIVEGLPAFAAPRLNELSTRSAGRGFRVPAVSEDGTTAELYIVDDDGNAEFAFGYDVANDSFYDYRSARLDDDDSLIVQSYVRGDETVRLLPDFGGADVVFRNARGVITGP